MSDPLAQVVDVLRPALSFAKLVEAAGAWRVQRAESGRPFLCAMLEGTVRLEVGGTPPLLVEGGDLVLIPENP